MSVLESIFLGVLQGITEFIPVSSSGHLIVARHFIGLGEIPLLYDVLLHISTLIVIIIVFREKIIKLFISFFRFLQKEHNNSDSTNLKVILLILIATLITGIIGIGISTFNLEQHPKLASLLFLVTAGILIMGRFTEGKIGYEELSTKEALILGVVQGFSVLPGISRSGSTISASLLLGINREEAGEFSFLISIPAVIGALVLTLLRDYQNLGQMVSGPALTAGLIASFAAGLAALLLLIKLVKQGKLYVFSIYLIPLGIITWFLF